MTGDSWARRGVRSLGFRTDLALLVADGSEVERGDGHRIVRTTADPRFRWGNFLLLDEAPDPEESRSLVEGFRRAFPDAGYVAFGVDLPHPRLDVAGWLAQGFTLDLAPVLVAPAPLAPLLEPRSAVRALAADPDWAGAEGLDVELWAPGERDYVAFARIKWRRRRALVAGGRGAWFGAFAGERLVASLGLVLAGDGTARYQQVETHPDFRRQGLASALLVLASGWAARHDVERLVIVAEPEGPAADLYRSRGFTEVETQARLERLSSAQSDPSR